jgi:hypothetical protein
MKRAHVNLDRLGELPLVIKSRAMKRRWRLLCPSQKDLHHENIERMIGN